MICRATSSGQTYMSFEYKKTKNKKKNEWAKTMCKKITANFFFKVMKIQEANEH